MSTAAEESQLISRSPKILGIKGFRSSSLFSQAVSLWIQASRLLLCHLKTIRYPSYGVRGLVNNWLVPHFYYLICTAIIRGYWMLSRKKTQPSPMIASYFSFSNIISSNCTQLLLMFPMRKSTILSMTHPLQVVPSELGRFLPLKFQFTHRHKTSAWIRVNPPVEYQNWCSGLT